VRYGQDITLLLSIGGAVLLALLSVVAWVTGRRVGGMVLAVMAGVGFAFAIALFNR
jgi:hypothetical protein